MKTQKVKEIKQITLTINDRLLVAKQGVTVADIEEIAEKEQSIGNRCTIRVNGMIYAEYEV